MDIDLFKLHEIRDNCTPYLTIDLILSCCNHSPEERPVAKCFKVMIFLFVIHFTSSLFIKKMLQEICDCCCDLLNEYNIRLCFLWCVSYLNVEFKVLFSDYSRILLLAIISSHLSESKVYLQRKLQIKWLTSHHFFLDFQLLIYKQDKVLSTDLDFMSYVPVDRCTFQCIPNDSIRLRVCYG